MAFQNDLQDRKPKNTDCRKGSQEYCPLKYSVPLNNSLGARTPHTIETPSITFNSSKNLVVPCHPQEDWL